MKLVKNTVAMNKLFVLMLFGFVMLSVSCSRAQKSNTQELVVIETDLGTIKLKLYDDTPGHKANFLKLINEGFYDGLLFHRVMNNFMIQGGDPNSKDAKPGERLGAGNPGYTIPAEIQDKYFHKKGALAAARKGTGNPEKRSSGSQFYIVHGEVFTPGKLDTMEMMLNNRGKEAFYKSKFAEATEELNGFRANNDQAGFNAFAAKLRAEIDSLWQLQPQRTFPEERRAVYTTIGGYPSLDGEYTVFGEMVEGFDVLDKIAAVETDKANRPINDIKMKIVVGK